MPISLTQVVADPDVGNVLDRLFPSIRGHQIRAPWGVDAGFAGTVYDYMVRFELQRRNPNALAGPWVGEHVLKDKVEEIERALEAHEHLPLVRDENTHANEFWLRRRLAWIGEEHGQICEILEQAYAALGKYLSFHASPPTEVAAQLLRAAGRLAKLDLIYRSPVVPDLDAELDRETADYVRTLLEQTPWDSLCGLDLRLNPDLATGQFMADADLISDGCLLELKTGRSCGLTKRCKVQLFGYLMLCREKRRLDSSFPEITEMGVYFARHGYLLTFRVDHFAYIPGFQAVEEWFLSEAAQLATDRSRSRWTKLRRAKELLLSLPHECCV